MSTIKMITRVGNSSLKEYLEVLSQLFKEVKQTGLTLSSKVDDGVPKTEIVGTEAELSHFVATPVVIKILDALNETKEQRTANYRRGLAVEMANALEECNIFALGDIQLPPDFKGSPDDFIKRYAPDFVVKDRVSSASRPESNYSAAIKQLIYPVRK